MGEKTDYIIEQIIAFYLGEISDREKDELEVWVNESGENREIFKKVIGMCQRLRLTLNAERAVVMKERVMEKYRERERLARRRRILRVVSYAAILVLAVGVGYISYLNREGGHEMPARKVSLLEAKHGERVAILQLTSGTELILKDGDERELDMGAGTVLSKDSIRQAVTAREAGQIADNGYNTVVIPRGGEYNLTLVDGTNVWLNSESELKFPTRFTGEVREVYLKGEAFFEVASDAARPFIVKTAEADVKVLGTSFNVMNYEDVARVEVALESGKVEFTPRNTSEVYALTPGDVVRMDKESSSVHLTREDVSMISAWRTGSFYFEDMLMEELVVKLERWYQVKFVFANDDVKQMRFTGAVKKYHNLKYVLNIIERTKDISFVDFGDQIKIYRK